MGREGPNAPHWTGMSLPDAPDTRQIYAPVWPFLALALGWMPEQGPLIMRDNYPAHAGVRGQAQKNPALWYQCGAE